MKLVCWFMASVATLLLCAAAARAQTAPDGAMAPGLPPQLRNVGFDPQLNAQLPLDIAFRDEVGRQVLLRSYFSGKPVVVAFVYYGCPMLCNEVEQGLVGTLKMISFNPGREAAGWHFLTGQKDSIDALTSAANFRYSFDERSGLFAHASGILLLTPDGRISRYFFGVNYPGRDVRLGLVDASAGKIGTPGDRLLLFCFQYDPTAARYSATILRIIRLGGLLTVVCIIGGIVLFRRREARAAGAKLQGAR